MYQFNYVVTYGLESGFTKVTCKTKVRIEDNGEVLPAVYVSLKLMQKLQTAH
jgi:hypothetical protein